MKTSSLVSSIIATSLIGCFTLTDSALAQRRGSSSGSSNIGTAFLFDINSENSITNPNGNFVGVLENISYTLGNGNTSLISINTRSTGDLVSAQINNNSTFSFNLEIIEEETATNSSIIWTYTYSNPVNGVFPDPTSLDSIIDFMGNNSSNLGFSTYSTAFEDFWLSSLGLNLDDDFRQGIQDEISSNPLSVSVEITNPPSATTPESSYNFGILLLGVIGLGTMIKKHY